MSSMESSDTDITRLTGWVASERDVDELIALLGMWMERDGFEELVAELPVRLAGRLGDGCVVIIDDTLHGSGRVVRAAVDGGDATSLLRWGESLDFPDLPDLSEREEAVDLPTCVDDPWEAVVALGLNVGEGARAVVVLLSWSRALDTASRRLAGRAARIAGATIKRARHMAMTREALTYAQCRAADLEQRISMSQAVAQGLGEGVITLNAAGEVMFANPRASRMLGLRTDALLGRNFHDLVHPREKLGDDEGPCALDLALGSGSDVRCHDDTFERSDGARVAVVYTISPLPGDAEHRILAIRDMRDYQKMHARRLLTDRMVAMGTLASGIAHEINNPLSFVDANLRFSIRALHMSEDGRGPEAVDEALREALDGVERMRRIVDGMRAFSRGANEEVDWIDLEQCLLDAMTVSAGEVARVATMRRVGDALGQVRANTPKITQVLVNLLLNVTHAFSPGHSGGEVVVRTRCDDGEVTIEVRDNGRGIEEATLRQIFDPFFTTSAVGRGTGLGLFVARTLADELGGELVCESAVGEGTCFTLRLPIEGRRRLS